MSYFKKSNKLYIINDNNDELDKIRFCLKEIKEFKSIGFFNIEIDKVYISLNFKDNINMNDKELIFYINKINDVLITFNIKTNIYYNFNNNKKMVYKEDKPLIKINNKVGFIDDDD